jgi:Kef-type K+ transport system membrane component KefB
MEAAASILIDVFMVFVAAKLAGAVSTRLNQPPVIGELVVGILIGPYVLRLVGTVHPAIIEGFHGDLESARQALSLVLGVFAELGAVILLFFVGLETRLSDLMNVGWRAAMVGVFGTVVPFAGGFAVMALQGVNTASALFVAAALVATSVGITARVLEDLGVLHSAEARQRRPGSSWAPRSSTTSWP